MLQREVKARRPHVAVEHRRGEVQEEDEVPDDGAPYSCCRCLQSTWVQS